MKSLAKAWIGANWLFLKRGLGTSNQFESNGYIRSRAGMKYPDIQFHFLAGAIAYDGSSAFKGHGFQVHLGANKPKSRGWVKLKSADPEAAPEIVFNYFAEEEDKEGFRAGLRWTREIFAQPALDEYRGKEVSPGPDVQTDEQIDQWLAETEYAQGHLPVHRAVAAPFGELAGDAVGGMGTANHARQDERSGGCKQGRAAGLGHGVTSRGWGGRRRCCGRRARIREGAHRAGRRRCGRGETRR